MEGTAHSIPRARHAPMFGVDEAGWAALAASEGWNPAEVWGGVIPGSNLAELSPRACGALAAYVAAPPATTCTETTTKTVTRRVWKRVKVRGKWTRKRVAVRVKVSTKSVVGCPTGDSLSAFWTLAHESFHVGGIRDEPTADCYAIQAVELVALRLGSHPLNARRMGEAAFAYSYPCSRAPGTSRPNVGRAARSTAATARGTV